MGINIWWLITIELFKIFINDYQAIIILANLSFYTDLKTGKTWNYLDINGRFFSRYDEHADRKFFNMPSTDFAFKASKDLTSVAAFFLIVP